MQPALVARLRERVDKLVEKGNAVYAKRSSPPPNVISDDYVPEGEFSEWRSQSIAFLTALADAAPAARSYRDDFEASVQHGYAGYTAKGLGILRAVAEDIASGDLYSVQQLAASEVFADFMEMAQHLSESNYDAPAASLAGAVLEEGLRRLATEKSLKARNLESANDVLFGTGALTPMLHKQIKVWIDIRNAADHGEFDKIEHQAVASMISGVRDLLARFE